MEGASPRVRGFESKVLPVLPVGSRSARDVTSLTQLGPGTRGPHGAQGPGKEREVQKKKDRSKCTNKTSHEV